MAPVVGGQSASSYEAAGLNFSFYRREFAHFHFVAPSSMSAVEGMNGHRAVNARSRLLTQSRHGALRPI
jgi:hypothetical protein